MLMKAKYLMFPITIFLILSLASASAIFYSRASFVNYRNEYNNNYSSIKSLDFNSQYKYVINYQEYKAFSLVEYKSLLNNESITLDSGKGSIGTNELKNNINNKYELLVYKITLPLVNMSELEEELRNYLGNDFLENYGIYINDLKREQTLLMNAGVECPPASISKLPSVILTLKDIQEGKINFDTTLKVQNKLKHSVTDTIGQHPEGTELPFKLFIDMAILESNNSAHYHLHDYLGGAGVVNNRTQQELKAGTFFLDPHIATAESVGKVLLGIYENTILDKEHSDYLINLMKTTAPGLRDGIPGGVPSGIEVANKVGFLFGGKEGDTYADSAIVYGEKTDYILVVLNNRAEPFPLGYIKIRDLSEIVYNKLNSQ